MIQTHLAIDNSAVRNSQTRFAEVSKEKATGATFTPPDLADFVAYEMLQNWKPINSEKISILEPAAGDGALLVALLSRLPTRALSTVQITAFDTCSSSLSELKSILGRKFPQVELRLYSEDFLIAFTEGKEDLQGKFDLIISNPPYVRTQVLGSAYAQLLSERFSLTGRVDLYYPFLVAFASLLNPKGVMGVITSNRFITTKSGESVRKVLLENYTLKNVWDFGDTKLFNAAVLPAVILGSARNGSHVIPGFSSIYESSKETNLLAQDIFSALRVGESGTFQIDGGKAFEVRHGTIENEGKSGGIWRIASGATDAWLSTVSSNTWKTFSEVSKIRVGIKSTADSVFIRSDWDDLPIGRPELLRKLTTRHCADRWRAVTPSKKKHQKEVLYPHSVVNGRRVALPLKSYPISEEYLTQNRQKLESRSYLKEAGRSWYELWVPQDPDAWNLPKVVFKDISDEPTFWMDLSGTIVNGECYWITCVEEDLLWLILAIANSNFVKEFYDHKFNNKLYAGRRRFITQYVEKFPLPDPKLPESAKLVDLAKQAYDGNGQLSRIEKEINRLVYSVFGIGKLM